MLKEEDHKGVFERNAHWSMKSLRDSESAEGAEAVGGEKG